VSRTKPVGSGVSIRTAASACGPVGEDAMYKPFDGTPGTGISPDTGSGCHQ
jgi:hypothetical protein